MRHSPFLVLAMLAFACGDDPAEPPAPEGEDRPAGAAAVVVAPACTKSWASAIGGLWSDASRWTPYGVPSITDHVCIDAPGTYDVFHSLPTMVQSLRIGGTGATVDFEFDAPFGVGIIADDGIWIEAGSTLTVLSEGEAGLTAGAGPLVIHGELEIVNSCACGGDVAVLEFTAIENRGRMELDAPMTIELGAFMWENPIGGVIVTSGTGIIDVTGRSMLLTCGTVVGSTQIHVTDLYWCHGLIGSITTAHSVVQVNGGLLSLPGSAPQGMVTANTQGGDLTIAVGTTIHADIEIAITADPDDVIRVVSMSGSPSPPVNEGYIRILPSGDASFDYGEFTNSGRFDVIGDMVDFTGDEFINEGTFTILSSTQGVSFSAAAAVLRNRGQINAGGPVELNMAPGTEFVAEAGSHVWQAVEIVLDGATLRGDGAAGDVRSIGGSIQPGAPWGTLNVASLTLDAASEVVIDLAGTRPGAYSRLDVFSDISYAGAFRLVTMPGQSLGRCGDVFTPIKHGLHPPKGKFAAYTGLKGPTKDQWRVQTTADSIILAGYDTTAQAITVTGNGSPVVEGGATDQYQICLGPTTPTSNVVVVPTAANNQLVLPNALVFDQATWKLPKTVTLQALDDTVIEPTHSDTVRYFLRGSSPPYTGVTPHRTFVTIIDNDGDTDLQLVVHNAPASTTAGSIFEIAYRVTNHGPTLSTGATLTIDPQGATNVAFQQAFGATCTSNGAGILTCSVPGQAVGAQTTITLVYQASGAGNVSFAGTVTSQQPDPSPANDQAVANVVVN